MYKLKSHRNPPQIWNRNETHYQAEIARVRFFGFSANQQTPFDCVNIMIL